MYLMYFALYQNEFNFFGFIRAISRSYAAHTCSADRRFFSYKDRFINRYAEYAAHRSWREVLFFYQNLIPPKRARTVKTTALFSVLEFYKMILTIKL